MQILDEFLLVMERGQNPLSEINILNSLKKAKIRAMKQNISND